MHHWIIVEVDQLEFEKRVHKIWAFWNELFWNFLNNKTIYLNARQGM